MRRSDNEVQIMRDLIEHLGVRDHIVTFVGKQRSDREADVEQFVVDMAHKYPWSRVVVGDTSQSRKQRQRACDMTGLWCQVFKKADRGAWDEGAELRDERVVSECTDIIAFDQSSRVKRYCDLAKRMTGRKVWFV
jgi:hypothetical protein